MKIAVVGAGAVGTFYAKMWLAAGHAVTLTYGRDQDKLAQRATSIGADIASPREAVTGADVVLFSVPFETIGDAARKVGTLAGKIVIDPTNPFKPDRSGVVELALGRTAFSLVAEALPQARLVKALHNLGVVQVQDPDPQPAIFVVGSDAEARAVVSCLVIDAGLAPVESDDPEVVALSEAPGRLFTAVLDREMARAALAAR